MLLAALTVLIVILGSIAVYIKFISPRINPYNKAENYLRQEMTQEAIVEYKKIIEKSPLDVSVHYRLAGLYLGLKKYDDAAIHLEEISRIDRYPHDVPRPDVWKKLASIYLGRDETEKAFEKYYQLLRVYPDDGEALYHAAFISLGQGLFDFALRFFLRLVRGEENTFEILFGAGIAAYQNQKSDDAFKFFRDALVKKPYSDIGNLALSFTQQRRRDYKSAAGYAKMVYENSVDSDANFIAGRLLGILNIQMKRGEDALRIYEEILQSAREKEASPEFPLLLFDIGFVSIRAEKTEQAYEYWNELFQLDRNYENIQHLVTLLRKEMDIHYLNSGAVSADSIEKYADKWLAETFPRDYLWNICGLKSAQELNLKKIISLYASERGVKHANEDAVFERETGVDGNILEFYLRADVEHFRIVSNRLVGRLGYKVDEILETYREADGVDFIARSNETGAKYLVWVRRWKGNMIGDIILRNFAHEAADAKVAGGIFVTTGGLTPSAEKSLEKLDNVKVIYPDEVETLLRGLI